MKVDYYWRPFDKTGLPRGIGFSGQKKITSIEADGDTLIAINEKGFVYRYGHKFGYRVAPHCEKKKRELLNGTMENEKLINLCLRHFFKNEKGSDKRFLENMGWVTKEGFQQNRFLLTAPIKYKL